MFKRLIVLAACCLLPISVQANGYFIPEQGVKAVGMGNAFAAVADNASANWFNPAGLSFQANNISVSGDIIAPTNEYELNGATYGAKKKLFVVPQSYIRYGSEDSKFSFGLGINSPFGLSTDWGSSNAPFSQIAAGADSVTFSQIEGIHINPNVAYKINDHLSVAVGASYYNLFKVHLDNQALTIGGNGDGVGGNAALLYKENNWSFGVSYRSSVKVDVKGTAVGRAALAGFGLSGVGANVKTSLTLPDLLTGAVSFKPKDDWLISFQADWINWKKFNQIVLKYDPSLLNLATGSSTTIPEQWKATITYRVGMAWDYSEHTQLRVGYTYDPTPTNSKDLTPRLPGADRQLVSFGYGTQLSDQLSVDMAYAYVWLNNRTLGAPAKAIYQGLYKSSVHIVSLGMDYHF